MQVVILFGPLLHLLEQTVWLPIHTSRSNGCEVDSHTHPEPFRVAGGGHTELLKVEGLRKKTEKSERES